MSMYMIATCVFVPLLLYIANVYDHHQIMYHVSMHIDFKANTSIVVISRFALQNVDAHSIAIKLWLLTRLASGNLEVTTTSVSVSMSISMCGVYSCAIIKLKTT